MNYQRIYKQLIERARNRPIPDAYTEIHHVIPKCMGGTDDKDNLVALTASEHYVAHQLLAKIYPKSNKLAYAVKMMCVGEKRVNNKEYSWVKERYAVACKEHMKRINTPEAQTKRANDRWDEHYKSIVEGAGFSSEEELVWEMVSIRATNTKFATEIETKLGINANHQRSFFERNGWPINKFEFMIKFIEKKYNLVSIGDTIDSEFDWSKPRPPHKKIREKYPELSKYLINRIREK